MAEPRAIVIGTGAGGLAAAAYLARRGLDVIALEQSPHIGGFLRPFERDGFHFDVGVNILGEGRPGQLTYELLAGAGVDPAPLLVELDPDGFDVYRFPGLEVRRCRGQDAFAERLSRAFPGDAAGIARFLALAASLRAGAEAVMRLESGPGRLSAARQVLRALPALRRGAHPLAKVLREMVSDPRARAVLAANGVEYGLPPARAAAMASLLRWDHFADGAFYPRGGSGALRDALVDAARSHGARFRAGARVDGIVARSGRATGVRLAGGERIDADVIVSDVDPRTTLGQLLEPSLLPARLRRKIARTRPSLATFSLYLGMRRDLRAHGLGRCSVTDHPGWDLDALYAPVLRGELPSQPLLYLSSGSLKDDTGGLAPAGCSTLQVFTFVPYAMFAPWRALPPGGRGAAHDARKQSVIEWMLASLEARWPGSIGDIVVREASTPLSNESWVGAVEGGAYGPAVTPEQAGVRSFRTTTPLPNLFLAGAGVLGSGVATCLLSGRIAADHAADAVVRGARTAGRRAASDRVEHATR